LFEDGSIQPNDSRVICSVKDTITTKDLLENNYVGFGRMFRNIPGIFKEKYSKLPYVDWPISYELSKHGTIKYNESFGGLYRISKDGMYSKLSEEEKNKGFNAVKNTLIRDYNGDDYNSITIIDSFISNESVLSKLKNTISKLKEYENKILLVSNTIPPKDVINSVDYFLYNHENKLFSQNYDGIGYCDLWKSDPQIVIHEISEEFQKHGLSVLANLFNSLDLAKSLGFTHFQRIEIDGIFSDKAHEFMKTVPHLCKEHTKKSLFYLNQGKDASFHYFFSEIDFFLNNVYRITDENSYNKYLKDNGLNNTFKPVEVFLYENLINHDIDRMLIRDGEIDMNRDFEGTIWNTESSQSTLHEKYEGCSTKIYRVSNSSEFAVLTFNYTSKPVKRKIIVKTNYGEEVIYHNLDNVSSWSYNIFGSDLEKITVYDQTDDRLLYEMENKIINDYIELK